MIHQPPSYSFHAHLSIFSGGKGKMVRFLKSQVEELLSEDDFDRVMAMENLTSILYIPASILISMDILGRHGIIPYLENYRWRFLLPASAYLALANIRDLHICTRNFLISNDESVTHKTLLGHMQITAALLMSLGSLSLLNASIIGLLYSGDRASDMVGAGQYVVSFGFFVTGCAANTVPLNPDFAEYDASRAMLTFQYILACVLLFAEGILMLPGLIAQDRIDFRDLLARVFAVAASALLMFSSVVNYFQTLGLLRTMRNVARASEECEYTRKLKSRDDLGRRIGFFNRIFGMFSSGSRETRGFSNHAKYRYAEIERPDEDEPLVMSDASSDELEWDEATDGRNMRDAEEGRYRSDSEEKKRRDSSRKKKRKGRKR